MWEVFDEVKIKYYQLRNSKKVGDVCSCYIPVGQSLKARPRQNIKKGTFNEGLLFHNLQSKYKYDPLGPTSILYLQFHCDMLPQSNMKTSIKNE